MALDPYSPPRLSALQEAREEQQRRRRRADRRVSRHERDDERTSAHQQDGEHQRGAPPASVADTSENIGADGPHEEAEREDAGGGEHLRDRIVARKESVGKIKREGRIDVEIVPFDQIAGGADENGADPRPVVVRGAVSACQTNWLADVHHQRKNGRVEEKGDNAMDERDGAHTARTDLDIGGLAGDADHIREIQEIDILRRRASSGKAGRRAPRVSASGRLRRLRVIFMRIMEARR